MVFRPTRTHQYGSSYIYLVAGGNWLIDKRNLPGAHHKEIVTVLRDIYVLKI